MTDIPDEVLGDHARRQALLDSDPRVLAPEGAEIDKWDQLKEATVEDVAWEDDELHVWLEGETTLTRQVASATHWEPAAYEHDAATVYVGIVWDFDPESCPTVDMEVVPE